MAPAVLDLEAIPAGVASEPVVAISAAPAALRAVVVHHVVVVASWAIAAGAVFVLNAHALAAAVQHAHLFVSALCAIFGRSALQTPAAAGHAHFVVEVPELTSRAVLFHEFGFVALGNLGKDRCATVFLSKFHIIADLAHLD